MPHRHPRGPRRLAGQARRCRSSPATRASASSRSWAQASPAGPSASASPSLGSARPAASAATASTVARPCARQQQNSGYSIDGAFAEYAVASATYVVPVPDGISSIDAAPLSCAGVTTYKAVKVAHVEPTELVGIFGIGGLGHLAVQYARIMGGTVVAIDIEQPKLDLAAQLGAEHLVNAAAVDPVAALQALGGLDVAVVLAASPRVFEQAFASLRRGGRLVCVALPADGGAMDIPIFETVLKGISIIGSIVGTRQDLAEVFALHAAGRTRVIAETRSLDDVNEAIAEVLSGKVPARLVFDYAAIPATV